MRPRGWWGATVAAVAAVLVLAGCTGVPTSSAPQTVEPIEVGQGGTVPAPGPTPGADGRSIVTSFMDASAIGGSGHATARKYLAKATAANWSDAAATIIRLRSVTFPVRGYVTVQGAILGQLTPNGTYVPVLTGTGEGGPLQTFRFGVARVGGQYRITKLPLSGLLITDEKFSANYRQHALYFFDPDHHYLVPDPRWTALTGSELENWLVDQLATGPASALASTVVNDTLPQQATSRSVSVRDGPPLRVEVPGAAQLGPSARQLLAAQITATVTDPTSSDPVVITDGGTPVPMPGAGDPDVNADGLFSSYQPATPAADVFYLVGGHVVRDDGTPLEGRLRQPPYFLSSVAVTRLGGGPQLTVAGVAANRLVLGTQTGGYRLVEGVKGTLSRPAWAPPLSSTSKPEVWVGVGDQLVRVQIDGNAGTPSVVSINAPVSGGRIVAVRLSPEGARVALVIASPDGSKRLYVGSVVRSGAQVRLDALTQVSPVGVAIDDVGWIGPQKLIAIGEVTSTREPRIFETGVDGSFWASRATTPSLPDKPDSVTVAVGQLAWVSANGTVWVQQPPGWTSPGTASQVVGTKPVYLE